MALRKNKIPKARESNRTESPGLVEEPSMAYLAHPGPGRFLGIMGGALSGPNQQQKQLKLIRGGLSRGSLDVLMRHTGISLPELAEILEVTDRTLRRYDSTEVLNKRLSERAFEIARLYARGEEVFGDGASFRQWMDTEVPALGHQRPKSFLDTSMGIQMLMDELGRIEHGVFG